MEDSVADSAQLREQLRRARQEIAELKSAAQAREAFMSIVYDNSEVAIFVVGVSPSGEYIYEGINKMHESLSGLVNERLVGQTPDDLVESLGEATVVYIKALYDECVQKRETIKSEFHVPAGQAQGWWYNKLTPLFDEEGDRVVRLIGCSVVITELKAAEQALRESEQRLQSVFDSSGDAMMLLDRSHRVEMSNRAAAGDAEGEAAADLRRFASPADEARVRAHLDRVIARGAVERFDSQGPRADGGGEAHYSSIAAPVIVSGEVVGSVVSVRDVSEQVQLQREKKALEAQYRHAQKMEAVGRLTTGIAHDFNNALCAILGNAELMSEDLAPEDPNLVSVEEILTASQHAAALTRQLLVFSRKQLVTPKVIDLNLLISSFEGMLARLIGAQVVLDTQLSAESAFIRADRGQIEQVLLNLVVNARDAMPFGGQVWLETAVLDDEAGPCVTLSIQDSGCGIPEELRDKIFDPFFTTKELGQGTGLGLATVLSVVEQNGGHIKLQSAPDQGTRFTLSFPRVTDASPEPASTVLAALPRGGETVLLVEDEELVRKVALRCLGRLGYQVLVAGSAQEALSLEREHEGAIDLLFIDAVLPHVNGREVAEQITHRRPDTKVLFTSGYLSEPSGSGGAPLSEQTQLSKPYSPEALARKLREIFDGPAAA